MYPENAIAALIYIAVYLTAKSKNKNLADSHFYCTMYVHFTADLNRGGLDVLGDSVFQWVVCSITHCCKNKFGGNRVLPKILTFFQNLDFLVHYGYVKKICLEFR